MLDNPRLHRHLSETQARAIFEIAEDAIVSVDHQQRIILFNEGAEKLFGYTQNEILGRELELPVEAREPQPYETDRHQ